MQSVQLIIVSSLSFLFLLFACVDENNPKAVTKINKYNPPFLQLSDEQREEHPYGGWSCPDNILGFPAVDIDTLDAVPVILDRLPTKEETQNGLSLIYIDTSKVKNAKALDLQLPRLATYYSKYTGKNEKVIVIQAIEVDNEKIVGFRNINGGNGSCWIDEIEFLTESEVQSIHGSPFVQQTIQISAKKMKIWDLIANPKNSQQLCDVFQEIHHKEADLVRNGEIRLLNESNASLATGIISALWNDMYLQADYEMKGNHYTEKFLILPDGENYKLHVVAGPFPADFERHKVEWENWLNKVKSIAESQ